MTDGHAGADKLGELDRSAERPVLRFARRLGHPPEAVWRALTEDDHLTAWFPTTIEGERRAGAQLRFGFADMEAPPFEGEMLAFDPPRLLELRWGEDILRFEVTPDGDGSLLVFTDTFTELGKAARDGAGWHSCLDLLDSALAGVPAPWTSGDRWKQVHPAYVAGLGPEASSIGPPEEWERAHGEAEG